jgi:diacylglycerol kinase (ATP)
MKRYKVLFIYNPESGNGLIKNNLDEIIDKFQRKKLQVVPFRTERKEALLDVFAQMNPADYKKVVVAGGDGTINTVVSGMIKNNIDLPLAVFPCGTANDFAYYFDLPLDLKNMIKIATEEHYTYADIGKVNDKYFVNVAAMGFLVDVSQKTDPNAKSTLGVLSYYLRGIGELPNLKPIPVTLASAEYSATDNIYFMLVMNGRSAGGFKKIAPNASINDGKLDVVIFKEMPIIELMPLVVSVLTGNHAENKNVVSFSTERILIESNQQIGTDIDGEKGSELPLDISILHNRIRINTLKKDVEGSIW